MLDYSKTISEFIENQFPELYREEGQILIDFVTAYYEFLENDTSSSIYNNRSMFDNNDIDTTFDSFLVHFKEKYLKDFPFISATDQRFLVKNIMDYYRSKGSENSLKLLMRLLFNEEVDVYLPSQDVLKPSDSKWYRPIYLEVTKSSRTITYLNRQITGSKSGATAFVESIVTKRVDGKLIDLVYLSSVEGTFLYDDKITDDGNVYNAPTVVGSLTDISITNGGKDNQIGDIFDVITNQGRQGKVRVTGVQDATGKVDFAIINGGYGYTNTSGETATTVYISDAILNVNNQNLSFIQYEPVEQKIEKIYTLSATNINSANVGDTITGYDAANTLVATGLVVNVANTDANGTIITTASANSIITVQVENNTTFTTQQLLELTSNTNFVVGEVVEASSNVDLTVSNIVGTFGVGNTLVQYITDPVSNNIISKSFGTIVSSNTTNIVLTDSWGTFNPSYKVVLQSNTSVSADLTSVSVTYQGGRATVTSVSGSNVSINNIFGTFTSGEKVRGYDTKLIATINTVALVGADNLYLNGNLNSNGIVSNVISAYANGIIVGQNTSAIGIYGNTSPFYFSNNAAFTIQTNRVKLLSPPLDSNGNILDLTSTILDIKTGVGADFKIGLIENTETVTLNTDIVGSNNVSNTPYADILLSGANSGYGFVNSVTINSGGTLYANSTGSVSFLGGGFANGDPLVAATGSVVTNANGTITTITIDNPGAGYYTTPTIVLPSTTGTVANVSTVMTFGYGFPKLPLGDANALIGDVLESNNFTIGTIASLTGINPGSNYNADPFVSVIQPYVASYNRRDFYLELNSIVGSFKVGDTIEQIISGTTSAKGRVLEFNLTGPGVGYILVQRNSFNISFVSGYPITNSSNTVTAFVTNAINDDSSLPIGADAILSSNVVVANGVATNVEVIDSGYGYFNGGDVTLQRSGFNYVITGTSIVQKEGIGAGYWQTTTSHLDSDKKLHDNIYYQEYSYDIISGQALNKYENIVRNILHVAGNALFGTIERRSTVSVPTIATQSVITLS